MDDKFEAICNNVYYATDDGTKGAKGFVTDVLKRLLEEGNKYDEVIAIGPCDDESSSWYYKAAKY